MKYALILLAAIASQMTARAIPIPPQVTKVIGFIYSPDPATGRPEPAGTCFLIAVPTNKDPSRLWIYAVTNKHVLLNEQTKSWFSQIWVRLNTRGGRSQLVPIQLETSIVTQNLFPSHEPGTDLALIMLPDLSRFDVSALGTNDLTAASQMTQMNIAPGTDLFFSGMFSEYLGNTRIEPIVRFGRVAMIPEGKVLFGGVAEDLILAEVFSFGGNSGSPVFYYQGIDRSPGSVIVGTPIVKLAGVMQGFFPGNEHPYGEAAGSLGQPTISARSPSKKTPSGSMPAEGIPLFPPNSGIAAIIPAQKILDVLDYTELKIQQR